MTSNKIQDLESRIEQSRQKLQAARDRFKQAAVFDEETLKSIQHTAWEQHPKSAIFSDIGEQTLCSLLQAKVREGYEFLASQYNISTHDNGYFQLRLNKPDDLLDKEKIEVLNRAKDRYLQSITENEERLLIEMATLQTSIEQLEAELRVVEKSERLYEKNLDQLKKELLSGSEVSNV